MAELPASVIESLDNIAEALKSTPSFQRSMIEELTAIAAALGVKEISMEKLQQTIDETTDIFDDSIQELLNSERESKKTDEDYEKKSKGLNKSVETMIGATSLATKGVYSSAKALANTDGSLKSITDALSNIPVIGGVFSALGVVAGMIDDTVSAFSSVSKSGIQFSNGIFGLLRSSGELGMGLKETAEMFSKYSSVVQRVGAPAFTSFIKEVRTNSDKLYALGFTYDDIINKSAEFLETQRNLTGLRAINEQEQKILFNQAVDEFYKAAQVTGIGVTELLEEFNKMSKDPVSRLIMKQLPATGQQTLTAIQAQSPEMAATLMEALQKGGIHRVENYAELLASGVADEYANLLQIIQQGGGIEQVRDVMKSAAPQIEQNAYVFLERGQTQIAAHAAAFAKVANDFNTNDIKSTAEATAALDQSTKDIMNLQPKIQNAIADIRQQLLEGAISMLGPGTDLNKMLTGAIEGLTKLLSDPATMEAFKFMLGGLSTLGSMAISTVRGILSIFGADTPLNTALVLGAGTMLMQLFGGRMVMGLARMVFGGIFRLAGAIMANGTRRKFGLAAAALGAVAAVAAPSIIDYFSAEDKSEMEETPPVEPNANLPTTPEEFVEQVNRAREASSPQSATAPQNEGATPGQISVPSFSPGLMANMGNQNPELVKTLMEALTNQTSLEKMPIHELVSMMEAIDANINEMALSKEEGDALMLKVMNEYKKKLSEPPASPSPPAAAPATSVPTPIDAPMPSPAGMDIASLERPQPVQQPYQNTGQSSFASQIQKDVSPSAQMTNLEVEEDRIELAILDEMKKSSQLTQQLLSMQVKVTDVTREAFQRNTSVVSGTI
jgi:hypothetical protein